MVINIDNFFSSKNKNSKIRDFQDLDHVDGVAISTISANLYGNSRDDLVLFYFRNGAAHASVYTQSKIKSENIKWNIRNKTKKIRGLIVNTRNANAFTGKEGYKSLKEIAESLSEKLSNKQKIDEENPCVIKSSDILFSCTGTIGEVFPKKKILNSLDTLVNKIKYNQNKYVWVKAAMGIMTTDLKPKLAMEECKIGSTTVKIYGISKGSGMIFPNMATTLGFIFTDANLSSSILKKILKKNITNTFNAISCDGDTSTNDQVTIFSTAQVKNPEIKNINDKKFKDFDKALNVVLLNLAKRIAADGEGASKFIEIRVINSNKEDNAKKIAFSIANSPLVKTAIAGGDPNFGRVIAAIGKANVNINLNKLSIKFGNHKIIDKGQLYNLYNENSLKEYMSNYKIEILIDLGSGNKFFTAYTMDLTKKYIEINADYRS